MHAHVLEDLPSHGFSQLIGVSAQSLLQQISSPMTKLASINIALLFLQHALCICFWPFRGLGMQLDGHLRAPGPYTIAP